MSPSLKDQVTPATSMTMRRRKSVSPSQRNVARSLPSSRAWGKERELKVRDKEKWEE